jgi:2-oxoglutarate ferredoxin oxidoreductase subunit alpha
MTDPFEYPDKPMDRGKVLSAEELTRLGGFHRYEDVDGDGIPSRTLPGTDHPQAAYFTRGSGHNALAQYTERANEWEANLARLAKKFETARTLVPKPVIDEVPDAEVGLIAYGSTDPGMVEARMFLEKHGIKTSYLRLRALPTEETFQAFVHKYPRIYVVENNFDGQMHKILQTEAPDVAGRMVSVSHCDGLPLTGRWIAQAILKEER